MLVLEWGFGYIDRHPVIIGALSWSFLSYFLVDTSLRISLASNRLSTSLERLTDAVILIPISGHFLHIPGLTSVWVIQLCLLVVMFSRLPDIFSLLTWIRAKPGQLMVLGFALATFIGSILLIAPLSSQTSVSYHDALFTATSAVCVTGLSVLDISESFSRFGQLMILLLIQLGGLGIMSFSALLAMILHRRFSPTQSQFLQEGVFADGFSKAVEIIKSIFKFTLIIEAMGAVLLSMAFKPLFVSWSDAIFFGVFHSVSAFCNAGFSLFPNSLMNFSTHPMILWVVGGLVILGGIGFPVIHNVSAAISSRQKWRIQASSWLIIWMSLALIVVGTVLILLLEANQALAQFSWPYKWLNAFFQSVSSRTAGFNSVELSVLKPATLLVMLSLMYIGAAPGSTGGGVRVTTIGVMMGTLIQIVKGQSHFNLANRKVPVYSQRRALAIVMLSVIVIGLVLFTILNTQSVPFLASLFEVISAFGTVGFTLDLTPQLTTASKWIIMIAMFMGRVGALTLAFAISSRAQVKTYHYPEQQVPLV